MLPPDDDDQDLLVELLQAFEALPLEVQADLADRADHVARSHARSRHGGTTETGTTVGWPEIEQFLAGGLPSLLLPLHRFGAVELTMIVDGAADAVVEEFLVAPPDEAAVRSRVSTVVRDAFAKLEEGGILTRTIRLPDSTSEAHQPETIVELTPSGVEQVAEILREVGLA